MAVRAIPLNLLTLYADLLQGLQSDDEPAVISRRLMGNKHRLYARTRDGKQHYIGTAGDTAAETIAAQYRAAAQRAKARRKTITALKAAGISAPDALTGRVIDAFAQAGLFERGAILIGTAAFQLYPLVVGARLSSSSLLTQDADLALARLAVPHMDGGPTMSTILQAVDPTFAPRFHRGIKHSYSFATASGFMVELLTPAGRATEPILVRGLDCGAQPLKYLEYLLEDAIDVAALIRSGARVRVPQPVRFALHKLMVAQLRGPTNPKSAKDLQQSRDLLDALKLRDSQHVADAVDDLLERGPAWRRLAKSGLALIGARKP